MADPVADPDPSVLDGRAELALQIAQLHRHLAGLETVARAAQPGTRHFFGWASFSQDTGLTDAQEDFVGQWAPQDVLNQCHALREVIQLLHTWLLTHPATGDVDLALALICTFSDALPDELVTS